MSYSEETVYLHGHCRVDGKPNYNQSWQQQLCTTDNGLSDVAALHRRDTSIMEYLVLIHYGE